MFYNISHQSLENRWDSVTFNPFTLKTVEHWLKITSEAKTHL